MIIATSQGYAFDAFTALQALMNLLAQYRNFDNQVDANTALNDMVKKDCGEQTRKFRFKGARLEADASKTHPDSMCTAMRLTFLMTYDGGDGYEQIQLFNVTADDHGKLKGELYVA